MINRRRFIEGLGASVFPMILPAGATTYRANETVHVAAIGCGGRAACDIDGLERAGARIVALCDVDRLRSEAQRLKRKSLPFYVDWREMLDRLDRDIDAVMIGTPDHQHAVMSIECLQRGKHVQCEKPLCQSFHEMDAMLRAAAEHPELVTQAMNQGHAYDSIRDFRELVEAGAIGDVTEAHIWCPAEYSCMDALCDVTKTWKVPETLDWERWQGPVPRRGYCKHYLPAMWRFWTMYGSSTLGDWSCHLMDPIFWTFGFALPESVETQVFGEWTPERHGLTFPRGAKTTFVYRKPDGKPFKFVWYDGKACQTVPKPKDYWDAPEFFPPTMSQKTADAVRDGMPNGAFVYGTKGVIEYGHHGANYLRILPGRTVAKMRAEGAMPAQKYPRVPGGDPNEKPYNEFIAAVKGGPKVGSDFAYAGSMTQCALLGIAALFDPGKRLVWDAEKHQFANSSQANARLTLPRIS